MLDNVRELKDQYELALAMFSQNNFEQSEDLDKIVIKVYSPTVDLLNSINDKLTLFEAHPNVTGGGYILPELVIDLESGLEEIKNVNFILLELNKNEAISQVINLDYLMFTLDFFETIKKVNSPLEKKINILHFLSNENLSTYLFNFYASSQETIEFREDNIDEQKSDEISAYLSHNKHINQNVFYNPFAFRIINVDNIVDNKISNEIKKLFYFCFIEALSDSFNKQTNKFILNSKKKISISQNMNFTTINYLILINIFDFLITEHKYTEKYIIIKKVLTMYTQRECDISDIDSNLDNIWKTTRNYYDDYIEDNIKDFFDTKDQLLKEATSISKLVFEQTDKVNTSIIASILSILVVFATTLFRQINSISVTALVFIVLLFIAFSTTYYFFIKTSSTKRYDLTKDQFDYFIDNVSFIDETDLSKIKENYLTNPYENLKDTLRRFRNVLLSINVIAIVILVFFY